MARRMATPTRDKYGTYICRKGVPEDLRQANGETVLTSKDIEILADRWLENKLEHVERNGSYRDWYHWEEEIDPATGQTRAKPELIGIGSVSGTPPTLGKLRRIPALEKGSYIFLAKLRAGFFGADFIAFVRTQAARGELSTLPWQPFTCYALKMRSTSRPYDKRAFRCASA